MDNADERRIPQGGFLQESRFQVWQAAIHPQTPSVPGGENPPGLRPPQARRRAPTGSGDAVGAGTCQGG